MRRAAKVDDNQAEIVRVMRQMGASVWPTHQLGKGFPDLVVAFDGKRGLVKTVLVEVKDGKKPLSQRGLTDDEMKFHAHWKGEIHVIQSIEEAIELINGKL